MTEYRRKEGRVAVIEVTEPINFDAIRELTGASEISISFAAPQVYRTSEKKAPFTMAHERSNSAKGLMTTADGVIGFSFEDFIVRDETGRVHVYNPSEFRHAFEAVNADGEE